MYFRSQQLTEQKVDKEKTNLLKLGTFYLQLNILESGLCEGSTNRMTAAG